jgi:hypothetical protein
MTAFLLLIWLIGLTIMISSALGAPDPRKSIVIGFSVSIFGLLLAFILKLLGVEIFM